MGFQVPDNGNSQLIIIIKKLHWVRTNISVVQSLTVVHNTFLGEEFKHSTIGSLFYSYFFKIK